MYSYAVRRVMGGQEGDLSSLDSSGTDDEREPGTTMSPRHVPKRVCMGGDGCPATGCDTRMARVA
jgi:hypothetical protein